MADKSKEAQKARLESYDRETQEEKAARVAKERATEEAAAQALEREKAKYTPDEITRIVEESAGDIIKRQILRFINTPDFDGIAAVFPDAEQWAVDKLDTEPATVLIVFMDLYGHTDVLPDYLKAHDIAASLSTFAAYTEDAAGNITSPLENFLTYLANSEDELTPSARVITHGIMNDKTVNVLLKGDMSPAKHIDEKGRESWLYGINQAPKGAKKQVPVFIGLSDKKTGEPITTSRYIEAEDWTILDSVGDIIVTSLVQGASFPIKCTPDEIWRKENRIEDITVSPSASQRNEIIDRMDKMRFTELFMDLTAEANANYIDELDDDRITEGIVKTYFVEASYTMIKTEKGRFVPGYSFPVMPFLIKYCIAKNHMIFVDYDLLDTSDTTSGMTGIEPVRRYIVSQIGLIYKHKRDNSTILFDTLYNDGGIKTPEERAADHEKGKPYKNDSTKKAAIRQFAKEDRTKICAILESYVKRDYIKGYSLIKEGARYTGVKIKPNPDKYEDTAAGIGKNWTDDNGRLLKELI